MHPLSWLFGTSPRFRDSGLLVLRLVFGLALAFAHGMHKLPPSERFITGVGEMGFPAPVFFAWCASLAEAAGGLFLALGLLTRPAAFFVLFTMGVAFFLRHAGDPFDKQELSLLYGTAALCLLLAGPGRFSLDQALKSALARRRATPSAAR